MRGGLGGVKSVQLFKNKVNVCVHIAFLLLLFFHRVHLACHSSKSTGVTNTISRGSVLFKCPNGPWQGVRESACTIPGP